MSSEPRSPADQGRRKDKGKVQQVNKCLNEKKRREQENLYMEELAEYISSKFSDLNYPMIKPDKCGILDKTVSEVKRIKDEESGRESSSGNSGGEGVGGGGVGGGVGGGAVGDRGGASTGNGGGSSSGSSSSGSDVVQQSQVSSSKPSPSILASDVIGPLLLEALDGFLFMLNGKGRLEFVSENVTQYLRYTQDDLVGKSIFSIISQADHASFRKCLEPILSRSNAASAQGNRSLTFECSMIVKTTGDDDGEEAVYGHLRGNGIRVEQMQILAIRQQFPHDREADTSSPADNEGHSFLTCIARRIGLAEKAITALGLEQFTTKQDLSGKILDCDTSATIHGEALWREFVDTNILDFCHVNDRERLKKHHDEVLKMGSNTSGIYRFRMQSRFVFVQTKSKLFNNPATKLAEFIMSTHSIVRNCEGPSELKGSLQASLMQAIIGGQSSGSGNRDLQRHGNHLARVSSVTSLNQLLACDGDLPGDMLSLNGLIDMVTSDNSGTASGFAPQLAADAAAPLSRSGWGSGFQGEFSSFAPQVGSSAPQQRPPRGTKRKASSPASAAALRSPGATQRSPAGYFSSPASKRSSASMTPSPLASYGAQQGYSANSKSSYLFQDDSDLSALLDSVQDSGLGQSESNHIENIQMLGPMSSRPTSQGSGFPMDWNAVSPPPPPLPPLQALQQLQVNSISTFKDNIPMFNRTAQRRPKRDQGGANGVLAGDTGTSGAAPAPTERRSSSRPFQDLRLRELLINDDDGESQGGSSASDTAKRHDVKVLPLLTGAHRAVPQSADPESTKSPQWLMNPSPQQQPQSTTFADDHPDSSSNKDATVGGQAPSARNKILIQLLRQEDKDEDESEADPGMLLALNPAKQNKAPGSLSVLTALAKLEGVPNHHHHHQEQQQQQPAVVSALPDTSASPRDQERDAEPTSNSGTGSSNNLLKKLLNSSDDVCKGEGKAPKHAELLQKLLSDNSDDIADSNSGPLVESTSSGEMEADSGKATSSSGNSSSETSPTVSEDKSQFCRISIPKGDKLKEMLTSLWESDGSLKARVSAASAFRNSKVSSVDEAAADSTEFEADSAPPPPPPSSSSSGSSFGRSGENKNKLLLSLLQGSQPMLGGSVLNVGNISAVATVTPQMIMAKKSELAGLTARIPDVRFARDGPTVGGPSNLPEPDQAMVKAASTAPSSVGAPAVGQPSDAVGWPHGRASADSARQSCPPVSQQHLIPEKMYRDISDNDLNLLQECLSQNGSFDSPMTPYVDKLLDEFAQTSEGFDDTTILSQIEQIIMSSSMSIPEVDSLLLIGEDGKTNFLDPNEEVAIGAIQQQLMSIESASNTAAPKPSGPPIASLDSQFATFLAKGTTANGSVATQASGHSSAPSGSEASTINDLVKQFWMFESRENALDAPVVVPKSTAATATTTQNRHVVNQLQKILSSRNQDSNILQQQQQQQQQPQQRIAPNSSQSMNLGGSAANSTGLKSPMAALNKIGFTMLDSSTSDIGLIANLSEMMNVPHPPNKVAPSSDFRGSILQHRLSSQSSVDSSAIPGHAGSDHQRALMSCGPSWNQRDVSIMAGGAILQGGKASGGRPGATEVMTAVDDLISGGANHFGNSHIDIIDDLLASMMPIQQQQQQQSRVAQSQQLPGAILGDLLSEQANPQVQVNSFHDAVANRTARLSRGDVPSPMNGTSRNSLLNTMMSPPGGSGGGSGGGIMSPMLDATTIGGTLTGGPTSNSAMKSPALGMGAGFPGLSGGGHKTPGSYSIGDLQIGSDGRQFLLDRQSQRNSTSLMSAAMCDPVKSDPGLPLAPKVSGTSKNAKQALKLSIQSRTLGGQQLQQQQQQQQRSPASAGIGPSSLSRNDRMSQYYLQTGCEVIEGTDDCSNLIDCLSPMSDGFLGLPHDVSNAVTFSPDSILGIVGSRSQQQQQQQQQQAQVRESVLSPQLQYQRLPTQRPAMSSKMQQQQHRDPVGSRQVGLQLQGLMGDAAADALQAAPLVQMSDMAHRPGYHFQQARGGAAGAKQQAVLVSNPIQHLGDVEMQQQVVMQQQQQQSGGHHHHHHHLGLVQQTTDHQMAAIQQNQQQQQQLVAMQQQQQQQRQQNQQLQMAALQRQQSQQQQLATIQQQHQSQQQQQLSSQMQHQRLERSRQIQQQQQQQQRLPPQGLPPGGIRQALTPSPGHRPDLLQQLMMAGTPPLLPATGGAGGLEGNRTGTLQQQQQQQQNAGLTLQDPDVQVAANTGAPQSGGSTRQLMMQGYDAVPVPGGGRFLQQLQQTQGGSLGPMGYNGQLLADSDDSMRQAAFAYQNENEMMRKSRDGTSDDFIRLGLQKLINEHVHKDSTMNKARTGAANPTAALVPGSWKGGCFPGGPIQPEPTMGSYPEPKTGSDTLVVSPMGQGPVTVAHRPRTTTALLEKLLSEESG